MAYPNDQYGDANGNLLGLPAGSFGSFDYDADGSFIAGENLRYGDPVFVRAGDITKVWPPHKNKSVIDLSGDLVTSNSTIITVTPVVGSPLSTDAVVFSSTHAATMALIVAGLNADADFIALGLVAELTGARQITITGPSIDFAATIAVTAGAGQATGTYTIGCADKLKGIVLRAQVSYDTAVADVDVIAGKALSVLTRGRAVVRVPSAETLTANRKAYLIFNPATTDYKGFSKTSTVNTADFKVEFTGNPAGGLVEIDVQRPNA